MIEKVRETLETWRQIILRTRRPRRDEFLLTFRIVLLAILAIGAVGYAIHLAARFVLVG
ncbi:protein translocase SEC61 complex, gamma subunit [Pyrolobus fumarii 1A]|uniref:Protein translocase subunit SecE n=1 Tax=Pyrolobus fumarii (strain DSM 11204 / 1A) TaxID=694429 RepID=G0EEN2_PYRF1|nr:protein translocase SEC61 complex subunit gamma [Pyrolobus fumarii]AEM38854.1 protein translocase SEC61 complex, gamma subunit [Pyrolobus fumarii 1A]